jgi:hypothetical protein
MCGKSNPADQEICQFCQARIKPLHVSSQEQEGQESALPDWLSSLRQDEEPSQPAPPSPDSSADWLSGLRDQSDEQIGQEESDWESRAFDESLAAGDFSSRLDGFPAPEKSLPGESQARSAGKRPEEVEEEPDWWRKLGADQSAGIVIFNVP